MAVSLAEFNPYQQKSKAMLRRAEEALGADSGEEYMSKLENIYTKPSEMTRFGGGLYAYGRGMFDPAFARAQGASADMGGALANKAAVDTAMAYGKARKMRELELGRMGINPNSGRFAGLLSEMGADEAAATAANMTRARAAGAAQAFDRSMDLARMSLTPVQQGLAAIHQGSQQDQARLAGLANLYEERMRKGGSDNFEKLMRLQGAYGGLAQESEGSRVARQAEQQAKLDEMLQQSRVQMANTQRNLESLAAGAPTRAELGRTWATRKAIPEIGSMYFK
jgi:hypothetical protein